MRPRRGVRDPGRPPDARGVRQVGVQRGRHPFLTGERERRVAGCHMIGVTAERGRREDRVGCRKGSADRLCLERAVTVLRIEEAELEPCGDAGQLKCGTVLLVAQRHQRRAVAHPLRAVEVSEHAGRRCGSADVRDNRAVEVGPGAYDRVIEMWGEDQRGAYNRALPDLEHELTDQLAENERRGLTRVLGFGEKPALVVVDFMRAFTEPGETMPLAADFGAELAATVELLDAARAARVPVYFTAAIYDEPDLADAGIWAIKVPANASLRAGTPGAELDPRLGRRPDEALVIKKYASAFFGTDLASRLTARGVDTLLVCGCTTSGCVRASVVDGLQHGFRTTVVLEGVGDRNPAGHRQSMLDMQTKYADVATLAAVLDYLRGL